MASKSETKRVEAMKSARVQREQPRGGVYRRYDEVSPLAEDASGIQITGNRPRPRPGSVITGLTADTPSHVEQMCMSVAEMTKHAEHLDERLGALNERLFGQCDGDGAEATKRPTPEGGAYRLREELGDLAAVLRRIDDQIDRLSAL